MAQDTTSEGLLSPFHQQIEQLLEQISNLQTEMLRLQGETKKVEKRIEKFTKSLQKGIKDEDVERLQEFLAQYPDIYPEGLITGYFGPLTEKAVTKFQEKHAEDVLKPYGLNKGTGFVGEKTMAKINKLLTEDIGVSGQIPPGLIITPGIQKKVATTTATTSRRKIVICHYPPGNPDARHTITIDESALDAHLAHGDTIGPCSEDPEPTPEPVPPEEVQCEKDTDCGRGFCTQPLGGNICVMTEYACQEEKCSGVDVEYAGYYCGNSRTSCMNPCGDGICSGGENITTCPDDCKLSTCTDPDGHLTLEESLYLEAGDCCADMPTDDVPRPVCNKRIGKEDEGQAVWETVCLSSGIYTPGRGTKMSTHHKCPNGCKDGACIRDTVEPPPAERCIDPDGGSNYYTAAETCAGDDCRADFCTIPVASCSGLGGIGCHNRTTSCSGSENDCYLFEYACSGSGSTRVTDIHKCPNSCKDGACIETTADAQKLTPLQLSSFENLLKDIQSQVASIFTAISELFNR